MNPDGIAVLKANAAALKGCPIGPAKRQFTIHRLNAQGLPTLLVAVLYDTIEAALKAGNDAQKSGSAAGPLAVMEVVAAQTVEHVYHTVYYKDGQPVP